MHVDVNELGLDRVQRRVPEHVEVVAVDDLVGLERRAAATGGSGPLTSTLWNSWKFGCPPGMFGYTSTSTR